MKHITSVSSGFAIVLACGLVCGQQPANPGAGANARRVLTYLYRLPTREDERVLSGQSISSANAELADRYASYYVQLEADTGKAPAIIHMCYGWDVAEPSAIAEANKMIIRHWKRGGLVSVSAHPANPWTGGNIRTRALGECTYRDVITAGTQANARWMAYLTHVADGLAELRDAGVVVLWRPFHEMNGDFFWWSAGADDGWATPAEFRALWSHTFDYLCTKRQLRNLLWVYSPNAETSPELKSTTHYYPGNHQVDVVALDHYGNSLDSVNARGGYDALLALGKPIGLAEVGPAFWRGAHPRGNWDNTIVIRSIREQYPAICYFTYWNGWGNLLSRTRMAIVENRNAAELLNDPWVITLDEVRWQGSPIGQ